MPSESGSMIPGADRIDELRLWASSRLRQCRIDEQKFAGYRGKHPPQSLVEAWTERRSLQAVLSILGLKEVPDAE